MGRFFSYTILNNSVLDYLSAGLILAAGILAAKVILRRAVLWIKKPGGRIDIYFGQFLAGLLEILGVPLLRLTALYTALKSLALPPAIDRMLNYFILGCLVFFGVKSAIAFIGYGFKLYVRRKGGDPALLQSIQGIQVVIKFAVWTGAAIFFLDNLGFKVSALIAGLGITGIAVALAAQAVFKDIFGYFFILFDRPFRTGDFIVVGDFMGSIEHIGIKTTRIRSLSGEMLILSNSDLTDSRLRNYQLMRKRRVEFKVNVEYSSAPEQLRQIPKTIEDIIGGIKDASFERAHLSLISDYGLTYVIAYNVLTGDYNRYMEIQQLINLGILDEFKKRDVHLSYPGIMLELARRPAK
ncbi:MAG: mechanosensitive ion channel family protein [Candidatus Omnitrophica bacterium]|nr:mechanosensitive ion channel family protein [Candidatus Omnitrophota bacterium]MDD5553229.1 mechanosensitive ion channel family protein [Candidatus Omnitrophota bacterium]